LTEQSFLLDTNVISERSRRRPDARVTAFLDRIQDSRLFLSALTVGELRKGVEKVRGGDRARAARLTRWIDDLEHNFIERIIPVDATVATIWGRLSAERTRPVVDTLIAATALAHDLVLVTRDVGDVADTGALLLNPWDV
jgi:predicted nucleic acid-binding protein